MVAPLIESHARRKASERATQRGSSPHVDKSRGGGGGAVGGIAFWMRSGLHAGEPHGGRLVINRKTTLTNRAVVAPNFGAVFCSDESNVSDLSACIRVH
jgi:hypothetical protein